MEATVEADDANSGRVELLNGIFGFFPNRVGGSNRVDGDYAPSELHTARHGRRLEATFSAGSMGLGDEKCVKCQ